MQAKQKIDDRVAPKKVRIQFLLSQRMVKEMDTAVALSGVESKTELFRRALSLFKWCAEMVSKGYAVQAIKKEEDGSVVTETIHFV